MDLLIEVVFGIAILACIGGLYFGLRDESKKHNVVRRVAVVDGMGSSAEVGLYEELQNGDCNDLPWPEEWPNWVTTDFLKNQGFEVISA